ncbi:hypothetical protein [Lysinibacillus xylanilyticus]|uniref:hypothetical protein n=1 Tax=Lysinibacillus xylanilyticus TaxID=582475 RepID=UPI00381A82B3
MIGIDEEIERELRCVEDLTEEISMLARKGQINTLKQLERDLHNSLKQLEKLHERKRLWATVEALNKDGILAKVVGRVVEMA